MIEIRMRPGAYVVRRVAVHHVPAWAAPIRLRRQAWHMTVPPPPVPCVYWPFLLLHVMSQLLPLLSEMLPALLLRCPRSNDGWSVCVVYCLDSHFVTDVAKFMAGALQVGLMR